MNIEKLFEFGTVFAVALLISAIGLLWNIIIHGAWTIDWETSFQFALSLASS